MAFCTNCGSKLAEDQRFCSKCGTMVAVAPPAASAIPQEPIYSAPAADPFSEAPVNTEPKAESLPIEPAEVPAQPVPAEPEAVQEAVREAAQEAAPEKAVIDAGSFVFAPEFSASYDAPAVKFEEFAEEEEKNDAQPQADSASEPAVAAEVPVTDKAAKPDGKKKASRPRRKFLPVFCSVLICILLVLLMLPTFTLLTAQNAIKQETLLDTMNRIDMDEIPASFIDESDRSLKRMSLAQYICQIINSDMSNLNNIVIAYDWEDLTPRSLQQFLDETTFIDFFAEHAEGAIDAFLSGEDSYAISAKSIKRLLNENKAALTEKMNISASDRNYDHYVDFLVSDGLNTRVELPEVEEEILDLINFGLSFYPIAGLCLVMVLLIVLLFVTNRKDRLFAVKDTGIALMVGSALFLLVILAARILCSVFVDENPLVYLITTLVSCAAESILLIVVSVLALGVILLLAYLIARSVQRKRAAKAAI